ncbi:hypothetical protein M405DRAFT_687764, partial [Rhizopogon salebrosus TDB-379]
VILSAITAYQTNNRKRQCMGLHPLDTMVMPCCPCITMVRTRPTFYLVLVIKSLSDAVATGQWPLDTTEALKYEITGR